MWMQREPLQDIVIYTEGYKIVATYTYIYKDVISYWDRIQVVGNRKYSNVLW